MKCEFHSAQNLLDVARLRRKQPHTATQHALWAIKHRPAWAQSGAFLTGVCVVQQTLACALTGLPPDPAPCLCFVGSTSSSQLLRAATSKESPVHILMPANHAVAVRGHSSFVPQHRSSR